MVSAEVLEAVRRRLASTPGELTPHRVAGALRDSGAPVGDATVLAVHEELQRQTFGAGPLEPLLRQPGVTDVLVNGADEVWWDHGEGLERAPLSFESEAQVRRLAQRLAARAGRRLDDAAPWVDARLPDGTRLHAVLAPLARPGTVISLRVPAVSGLSLPDLVDRGMVSPSLGAWLTGRLAAGAAFVVSGGTGVGKTTLLAALLEECGAERVVIVEEATELRPRLLHVVGLEARPANLEGSGAVSVRSLVRQALRMRPDRLVVGEVRGDEVVDLLAALNTGHRGGCGTLHANSAEAVPARVEALALAAGLNRDAVHAQLAGAFDLVLHCERGCAGHRRLAAVGVPRLDASGRVWVEAALTVDEAGGEHRGPAARGVGL